VLQIERLGYRRLSRDLRDYPVQGCQGPVPHPWWPWTLSVNQGYHNIIDNMSTRDALESPVD
jgi:hypothetical protein